jgi:CheY-like chemotaxis protein
MPKILVVEDSLITSEVVLQVIGSRFEVVQAYNGEQGIAQLGLVDCVCVDGRFPGNVEFYAELAKSGKPFIIYSGDTATQGVGELAFVAKPTTDVLSKKLDSLLALVWERQNIRAIFRDL